jgi:hypothetical protein
MAHQTRDQYLAGLEWLITDATAALRSAVDLGKWDAVRKYAGQIERAERKAHLAKSFGRKRLRRTSPGGLCPPVPGSLGTAGAVFGRGRLPA